VRRALALAGLGLGLLVPTAAAHVQVTPAQVAPGDSATFTVLVPNERDVPTTKVQLKIPVDVIPFSFEEVPGWERTLAVASQGPIDSVTWTGSLPAGSFVRFTFLASSPEAEGTLTFPAVQTYEDGQEVAWIGPPDSEEPAPTVEVTAAAAAANAGGEDEEGAETAGTETTPPATTAEEPATSAEAAPPTEAAAEPPASVSVAVDDDGTPAAAWVGLGLGAVALVAALAALAVALRGRSRPPDGPSSPEVY
jgi:periplasmic copper chaperone A